MKKHLSAVEEQDVILKLELYLKDLQNRWDREGKKDYSWIKLNKNYIFECAVFIINILDELILFVEEIIPQGSDKKIAVLTIVARLFDHIVLPETPTDLPVFRTMVYFIPASRSRLLEWGEQIYGENYQEIMDEVDDDQVLFGLFSRTLTFLAVFLENEAQYNGFMLRCHKNQLQQLGFFAINKYCLARARAGLLQIAPP